MIASFDIIMHIAVSETTTKTVTRQARNPIQDQSLLRMEAIVGAPPSSISLSPLVLEVLEFDPTMAVFTVKSGIFGRNWRMSGASPRLCRLNRKKSNGDIHKFLLKDP